MGVSLLLVSFAAVLSVDLKSLATKPFMPWSMLSPRGGPRAYQGDLTFFTISSIKLSLPLGTSADIKYPLPRS